MRQHSPEVLPLSALHRAGEVARWLDANGPSTPEQVGEGLGVNSDLAKHALGFLAKTGDVIHEGDTYWLSA